MLKDVEQNFKKNTFVLMVQKGNEKGGIRKDKAKPKDKVRTKSKGKAPKPKP